MIATCAACSRRCSNGFANGWAPNNWSRSDQVESESGSSLLICRATFRRTAACALGRPAFVPRRARLFHDDVITLDQRDLIFIPFPCVVFAELPVRRETAGNGATGTLPAGPNGASAGAGTPKRTGTASSGFVRSDTTPKANCRERANNRNGPCCPFPPGRNRAQCCCPVVTRPQARPLPVSPTSVRGALRALSAIDLQDPLQCRFSPHDRAPLALSAAERSSTEAHAREWKPSS